MKRIDGRKYDELRPVEIITGYQSFAEGSALIKLGKTHVLCSVSVEERVPPFLRGSGTGWITAEYAMLPRATVTRSRRDSVAGRVGGRNQEIQRLIGRSLRAVADLDELGENLKVVTLGSNLYRIPAFAVHYAFVRIHCEEHLAGTI